SFNPTRQSTPGPGGSSIYSLDTAQLSISYVPDVFGVYRRQVESLSAQAEARRFEREATYVTLTSNIVAAAIQEASLRGQIDATHETIQLAQLQLEMTQRQRRAGQIGAAEVAIQEATVAQFQAALPPLEGALALQRHLLTILAGRFPSEEAGERFELAAFDLPAELPVSLPSRLVEQRPDVRAAEAQLQAASAQIGIAVANRLPAITLTASRGSQANEVSKLFKAGSGFWGVGAQVAETLFAGGALLHTQRAAEAAYEQAWAQYRSTVLRAFQNVADALTAIQNDATVLKAADTAEKAAEKSLKIARQQWMAGLTGYLGVQVAQLSYQQALLALIQAQASRLSDTAALFQALGGGWCPNASCRPRGATRISSWNPAISWCSKATTSSCSSPCSMRPRRSMAWPPGSSRSASGRKGSWRKSQKTISPSASRRRMSSILERTSIITKRAK
ncbi:MAG: efflux transporter outer membrane subunit, partial [Betaproteobacteria bacterium]